MAPNAKHSHLTTLTACIDTQSLYYHNLYTNPHLSVLPVVMSAGSPFEDVPAPRITGDMSYNGCDNATQHTRRDNSSAEAIWEAILEAIRSADDADSTYSPCDTTPAEGRRNMHNMESDDLDHLTLYVQCALGQPSVSPTQQRFLNSLLNSLSILRQTISGVWPLCSSVSQYTWFSDHLTTHRSLSAAAIRQNERARIRRTIMGVLQSTGCSYSQTSDSRPFPIRYNDAYDDLVGIRSLDDGTPGAYAERDGYDSTYRILFTDRQHNGLSFQRGHLHITTSDRNLVETQQARTLAGLQTQDIDEELAYRVIREPYTWGA
jgi:hypothetical protein